MQFPCHFFCHLFWLIWKNAQPYRSSIGLFCDNEQLVRIDVLDHMNLIKNNDKVHSNLNWSRVIFLVFPHLFDYRDCIRPTSLCDSIKPIKWIWIPCVICGQSYKTAKQLNYISVEVLFRVTFSPSSSLFATHLSHIKYAHMAIIPEFVIFILGSFFFFLYS